jgi:hypothetical protein
MDGQCCESAMVSMQIRIQVAKPMRIHEDANPDPGQTLKLQKVKILDEKYNKIGIRSKNIRKKVKYPIFKTGNQFYFKILVYFHVPGSGSAFPIPIRIQDVK